MRRAQSRNAKIQGRLNRPRESRPAQGSSLVLALRSMNRAIVSSFARVIVATMMVVLLPFVHIGATTPLSVQGPAAALAFTMFRSTSQKASTPANFQALVRLYAEGIKAQALVFASATKVATSATAAKVVAGSVAAKEALGNVPDSVAFQTVVSTGQLVKDRSVRACNQTVLGASCCRRARPVPPRPVRLASRNRAPSHVFAPAPLIGGTGRRCRCARRPRLL